MAVMGQNLALNIADKGFSISVFNRSFNKTEACVARAAKEDLGGKLIGLEEVRLIIGILLMWVRVRVRVRVLCMTMPNMFFIPCVVSRG